MTVLYVLSMLNPPCVLVHHVHTYICLGLQVKRRFFKGLVKRLKMRPEVIACLLWQRCGGLLVLVLCCAVDDHSVEFFGGRSEESVTMPSSC